MKKTCRKCRYSQVNFGVLDCSQNVIYPCFPKKLRMQIRFIDTAVTCKYFKFNYLMIVPLTIMSIVSLSSKVHDKIQKKVLEPKKKPTNKFSTKSGKRIKPPTKKKGILNDVLSEAKKIIKPKKKQRHNRPRNNLQTKKQLRRAWMK